MPNTQATILNVDDDEIGRYATTRLLKIAGFDVFEASSGQQCLDMVTTVHPDLVLLDIQLPDINGFEVCQRLKSDPSTVDIMVLHLSASYINSDDRALGLEEGADGYLTQPVEPPVLIGHIRALLRMRQAEHAARLRAIQWQTTFDAISDAIFIVDKKGKILQCNQAMCDLIEKTNAQICGRLLDDIVQLEPNFPPIRFDTIHTRKLDEIKLGEKWFLITSDIIRDSSENNGVVFALTDITIRKKAEEENERLLQETRQASVLQRIFMRDMLSSVTDGKLRLCLSKEELPLKLPEVNEIIDLDISTLSTLRRKVNDVLEVLGFPEDNIHTIISSVHEAASNAIVHGGGGTLGIYKDCHKHKVQFWIIDTGSGIEVEKLPQATLQRGYTTSGTFGHGFKIVIHAADAVWLLTGANGTTVVIEETL